MKKNEEMAIVGIIILKNQLPRYCRYVTNNFP